MIKTSVYLPQVLKRALERAARRSGTSEAGVIRTAIERFVAEEERPRPRLPLFSSNDPTLARRVDEELDGFGT